MIPVHRFEDQIRAYEKLPVETGKVLLYGSSFFAFWGYDRAKQQCRDATKGALPVVNHGFGGATVEELLYYYHRAAETDPQLFTLDLNPFVYESNTDLGACRNFKNIFREDGLHLTDTGYEELAQYLAPRIQEILNQ